MAEKKSFLLYLEDLEDIEEDLTEEEIGQLLLAVRDYVKTGRKIETDNRTLRRTFRFIASQMDRDAEKWEQTVKRRSEAGKKGGAPKGNQNAAKQPKQAKQAKQPDAVEEQAKQAKQAESVSEAVAVAEAVSVAVSDAVAEAVPFDASHHEGVNARARRADPGAGKADRIFDSLWEQYPAEGQTRRDFVPDSCVQDCIENADDVRLAIEHYAAHIAETGRKLMSGCDFFRGAWRGFADAAPPGRRRPAPAPEAREIVQTQHQESFTDEDLEALVNQF